MACWPALTSQARDFMRSAMALFILVAAGLYGCGENRKPAAAEDGTAVQQLGNRVIVPAGSPLAGRLEVETAQLTTFTRQVAAPASVEADPARYARILPPMNGRVLQLYVHPGDAVKKGQELLAIDAPDFV